LIKTLIDAICAYDSVFFCKTFDTSQADSIRGPRPLAGAQGD
jgi:hypothetical protein